MTCDCPGNVCTCTGAPKLKDGATFTIPVMLKDNAMPSDTKPQPTADALPTATMTLDEAMALPRYAGMWPSQRQQYAARDLAMAKAGKLADPAYQQGVRDAYAERMENAWKGDNDNRPAPVTDAATAHQQLRSDLSEAWKH